MASMDKKIKISDEELAAFLEHKLSTEHSDKIAKNMDVNTLEVLNVSRRAMQEINEESTGKKNKKGLPSWENINMPFKSARNNIIPTSAFFCNCCMDENIDFEICQDDIDDSDSHKDDLQIDDQDI